jgi:hypothetical protein
MAKFGFVNSSREKEIAEDDQHLGIKNALRADHGAQPIGRQQQNAWSAAGLRSIRKF